MTDAVAATPRRVVERRVDVGAPADVVWSFVTTPAGIDHELGPLISMRMPNRFQGVALDEVPVGERLGRAWLLVGRFIPLDFDDLMLVAVGPGHFSERSSMWWLPTWHHDRRVVDAASGQAVVTDRLGFTGRWRWVDPVAQLVVTRLFAHRHRRLARRFDDGHASGAERRAR